MSKRKLLVVALNDTSREAQQGLAAALQEEVQVELHQQREPDVTRVAQRGGAAGWAADWAKKRRRRRITRFDSP